MNKVVIFLVFSFINYCSCCTGCVDLDELTFDKVIPKFKVALVKFDQQFPFGEVHDSWIEFAAMLNNFTLNGGMDYSEILIGTVGIKDYSPFDNKPLGDRFGSSKRQELPFIKLFNDGNLKSPIDFQIGTEKVTISRLYEFLKANTEIPILAPGCTKELDEMAMEFVNQPDKRKDIVKEAAEFIENMEKEENKKLSKTYTTLMNGVIEKGEVFVLNQHERMTKLLKNKMTDKKREEINQKINIIGSFKFSKPEKSSGTNEEL
ncbi:CLUMA_CG009774, isoform A [Clunio marinus]|uniref:CLUMA_CG009774, isoform A n=1 Tax=Clunio marinus TaxID=568069 RepID=A0A1J1I7U2_9DIPT|nr:CLUMA_CG009774, isoform A [Clunio marinus]